MHLHLCPRRPASCDRDRLVRLRHGAHIPSSLEGSHKEGGVPLTLASRIDFVKLFAFLETAPPGSLKVLSMCSLKHLQNPQGSRLPVSHQAHLWAPSPGQLLALSGAPCSWESDADGPTDTDAMSLWSRPRVAVGEGPASGL